MLKNSGISIYLAALVLGWLSAHVVKFVLELAKGKRDLSVFFRSGSMPSSHTAVVIALLTVIGGIQGIGSAAFGIVATFGAIVVFDALNVRRSVGEQAEVLKTLSKRHFFAAKGHTPAEAAVGALIGVAAGLVLLQIL